MYSLLKLYNLIIFKKVLLYSNQYQPALIYNSIGIVQSAIKETISGYTNFVLGLNVFWEKVVSKTTDPIPEFKLKSYN